MTSTSKENDPGSKWHRGKMQGITGIFQGSMENHCSNILSKPSLLNQII
jgi:hypothetical protein